VRLLQDVYFLEWDYAAGTPVSERQKIGFIESSKAESELFSPLSGQFAVINEELMSDPSAINTDKYGRGWIFEIAGDRSALLTPEQYIEHLASVWEVTQRTIKGQLNE
jgi:glycine cleavage system H protein